MRRDASVEIDESDIYALLKGLPIAALACDSCMLAAVAKLKLAGKRPEGLSAPGATFIEGADSQWNEDDEYCGRNHHVRMKLGRREQVVRLQVTEGASAATVVLQELFHDQLDSAMALLGVTGSPAYSSRHDCTSWALRVWTENESGDLEWEAADSSSFSRLFESIASYLQAVRTNAFEHVAPPSEVSAGVFIDTTDLQSVGDAVCPQRLTNSVLVEVARVKLDLDEASKGLPCAAYEVVAGSESEWELEDRTIGWSQMMRISAPAGQSFARVYVTHEASAAVEAIVDVMYEALPRE